MADLSEHSSHPSVKPRAARYGEAAAFATNVAPRYRANKCLRWPFSLNTNGYPHVRFRRDGRWAKMQVNRLVCTLAHGNPPTPAYDAAHSCGNPLCCNPRHLRWATRADNLADRVEHGTDQRGERAPGVKLTNASVQKIRSLQGVMSTSAIAQLFGVTQGLISQIHLRKIWKHIP